MSELNTSRLPLGCWDCVFRHNWTSTHQKRGSTNSKLAGHDPYCW